MYRRIKIVWTLTIQELKGEQYDDVTASEKDFQERHVDRGESPSVRNNTRRSEYCTWKPFQRSTAVLGRAC